jgi:5-methylcytosine-specific restriction enzyme A
MAICGLCERDMLTTASCERKPGTIRFGAERRLTPPEPNDCCHDCGVQVGGQHHLHCDVEECQVCGGQALGCDCPGHPGATPRPPAGLKTAERGYGSKWQRARASYLKRNPFCVACLAVDKYVAGKHVDHIEPHHGDMAKFWDTDGWQSLCARCHGRKTATHDGGFGHPRRRGR